MTTPTPARPPAAPAAAETPYGQGSETCCADCGSSQIVAWSPAWSLWLCYTHRELRTDKELGASPPAWAWMLGGQRPWRS